MILLVLETAKNFVNPLHKNILFSFSFITVQKRLNWKLKPVAVTSYPPLPPPPLYGAHRFLTESILYLYKSTIRAMYGVLCPWGGTPRSHGLHLQKRVVSLAGSGLPADLQALSHRRVVARPPPPPTCSTRITTSRGLTLIAPFLNILIFMNNTVQLFVIISK